MMSMIVQAVVAYDITGKNGAVGFVSLGMGIATILVSPFGGVVADRFSKKRMLFVGQALIGINFAVVGVLILTGHITLLMLAASTLILGTVFSFIGPARQAWIGELVPSKDLPNAIALQQVGMTATRVFGPFVAAGLIAISFVGTGGTYLFMAGLFVFVMFTLTMLPQSKSIPRSNETFFAQMGMGVKHMRERPRLGLLALAFVGVIIGGFSYMVILPGLLTNEFGRSSEQMAPLIGISAASGFIVTLGIAGLAGTRWAWPIMIGSAALLGFSIFLVGISPNYASAIGAMFLLGIGASGFQLINNALIMKEAEPAYHGRVMSITMLAWGFNSLVAWPFGLFADAVGERQTLMLMAAIVLSVTAATTFFGMVIGRRAQPEAEHVPTPVPTAAGGD
jgi:MFS family permease